MKFSDMLISLTGATSRARAIEELAWKSNIYAQEAEKLVDALDKMMPDGAWVLLPPCDAVLPLVKADISASTTLSDYDKIETEPALPVLPDLERVVGSLPVLDTQTEKRVSMAQLFGDLHASERANYYTVVTDAINDDRITRWHVKTIMTVVMSWLGKDFFTRDMPHKFDAVESMRSIVQQSERHIGATRNTLIRAIVLKAMDDGHHVLPTLLECAQIAAKQLKEKSDAQA